MKTVWFGSNYSMVYRSRFFVVFFLKNVTKALQCWNDDCNSDDNAGDSLLAYGDWTTAELTECVSVCGRALVSKVGCFQYKYTWRNIYSNPVDSPFAFLSYQMTESQFKLWETRTVVRIHHIHQGWGSAKHGCAGIGFWRLLKQHWISTILKLKVYSSSQSE